MEKKEKRMAKVKINAFPCLPILSSISESNKSIYIIIMQFICILLFVKVNISFQYFFEKYYSCLKYFNKETRKYDHYHVSHELPLNREMLFHINYYILTIY